MLTYPQLNPVALAVGPLKIHWYGLMYLAGFLFFLYGGKWRLKHYGNTTVNNAIIEDLMFYGALGVVLGGRLGYCLFYQPLVYLTNPLKILEIWHGGMSFHGGLLGVFVVVYLFSRKLKCSFFTISDFIAPLIPVGLFFGRIGNFVNGELWGRVSTSNMPWLMIFSQAGDNLPRHPSQLYEAFSEGLLLTLIMWLYAAKARNTGQVSGVFMICYGIIRFFLEYFRAPDAFLVNLVQLTGLSMGQWLSLPMIIAGIIILYYANKNKCS